MRAWELAEVMGRGTGKERRKPDSWQADASAPSPALEALLGGGWKSCCFSWMVPPGPLTHSPAIYWTPTR